MSHDWHEGFPGYHPDQILKDGCAECTKRSERSDRGISTLDPVMFARAWERARGWAKKGNADVSETELPLLAVLSSVDMQLKLHGIQVDLSSAARGLSR